MKMHLNLATRDLSASIQFYSTLLASAPVKLRNDYALFVTTDPGLELALDLSPESPEVSGIHFGICVESTSDVDEAIARIDGAGLATSVEREETCCYAVQTKVWAADPDGRRWEVYTVHSETPEPCVGCD